MGALARQVAEKAASIQAQIAVLKGLAGKPATDAFASHVQMGSPIIDGAAGKGLGFARAVICRAQASLRPELGSAIEIARATNKRFGGVYGDRLESCVKALNETAAGAGGVFSPDEFSTDFIEILRPKCVLAEAGIRTITMSGQTLTRARQSVATTGAWRGENQAIAYSQPAFDSPQLNLKDFAILCAISNDLLRDQVMSADAVVRDDLVKVGLLALDIAGIRGLGSAYQPRGIRFWIPSTNVTGSNAATGTPTLQNAGYDIEKSLTGLLNNLNVPSKSRCLLMHSRTVGGMKQLKDGVGGFPLALELNTSKTLFGLPVHVSTQIPTNLSGGGSGGSLESEIYCIEAQEVEMGIGLNPTVEVSREAGYLDGNLVQQNAFANDQTLCRMVLRADVIMRHNVSGACVNGCTY